MSDKKKISEMTPASSIISSDIVAGVTGGATKSFTAEQILMTKSLTAIRWDSLRFPITASGKGGLSDPDFVKIKDDGAGSTGVYGFAFDKTTEEEYFITIDMPHDWKIGTDLGVHAEWMPIDTDVGTIQWGMEFTMAADGAVFGNTSIVLSTATAAPGTAYQHTEIDMQDLDMSSITTMSPLIFCRIFRNVAGDTYNNDAILIAVDIHYQRDSLGSATEDAK